MQHSNHETHLFLLIPTSLSEESVDLRSLPLFVDTAALNSEAGKQGGDLAPAAKSVSCPLWVLETMKAESCRGKRSAMSSVNVFISGVLLFGF